MGLFGRIELARGRGLTLGVLMERLAAIHGDRPLVEEADDGLTVNFTEAADLVDQWAGGIAVRSEPGDRVVWPLPTGTSSFF